MERIWAVTSCLAGFLILTEPTKMSCHIDQSLSHNMAPSDTLLHIDREAAIWNHISMDVTTRKAKLLTVSFPLQRNVNAIIKPLQLILCISPSRSSGTDASYAEQVTLLIALVTHPITIGHLQEPMSAIPC